MYQFTFRTDTRHIHVSNTPVPGVDDILHENLNKLSHFTECETTFPLKK